MKLEHDDDGTLPGSVITDDDMSEFSNELLTCADLLNNKDYREAGDAIAELVGRLVHTSVGTKEDGLTVLDAIGSRIGDISGTDYMAERVYVCPYTAASAAVKWFTTIYGDIKDHECAIYSEIRHCMLQDK